MRTVFIIIIMIINTLIGAFGSLFLKKGSEKFHLNYKLGFSRLLLDILRNWKIILGIMLYLLSTVFFIILLKSVELSVLYPMTALSYIFVTILSIYLLKEKMNMFKWLGIAIIILGVALVTL